MKLKHSIHPFLFLFFLTVSLGVFTTAVYAQETTVIIRAQAKDAKFIGSSIGGALVLIKDKLSGKVLAEGYTKGSTGNTEIIMQKPQSRGVRISDENTAGFKASIDIKKPTFVIIEVYAPVSKRQATVLSSTQLWLLPGKDILGDGIIVEIPGFVVDILSPQTHESIDGLSKNVRIQANVVMMCGCPITKDGIWDASAYEVQAIIYKDGEESQTIPLQIESKASTFSSSTSLKEGNYEIVVYAFDPETGNTGVDKVNIIVK